MARKQLHPVPISTEKDPAKTPNPGEKTALELISRRTIRSEWVQRARSETAALQALSLFLLLSIGFYSLVDRSPECLLQPLGAAPDFFYINLAYAFYFISEALLTLSRFDCKPVARYAWRQLAFGFVFYAFFWFSGALAKNFALLLSVGVGLLLSEYFRLQRLRIKCAGVASQIEADY